jgi:RNA polymerase sigma-70 factor (ECF subfamily)
MPHQSVYPMTRIDRTSQQEKVLVFSIESLVREYFPYIRRLAFSILDDFPEADDIAQETFISAHRALTGFRNEADPKTWLTAIAVNACRGRLRKRKAHQLLTSTLQSLHLQKRVSPTTEEHMIQTEADQSIWQAVDNLDEKHRIPIILRYVHELNVPEIARILHIDQGTVHSRLHYARRRLHDQLRHLNRSEEQLDEV